MTPRPGGPRSGGATGDSGGSERDDAERARIAQLLGRTPRGPVDVVRRRPDGTPSVLANAPLLDDGTPMPTRYWLVDPVLREAVSRLEAGGGVRAAESAVDPDSLARAHRRYADARDALVPAGHEGPRPTGGVGGTRQGVKCLHAHLAWWLVGGEDPVGEWTAERLGITTRERAPGAETCGGPSRRTGEGRPRAAMTTDMVDHAAGRAGAIDCGTNSTRLLVVGADGAPLSRLMRVTRLGAGVDATGSLDGSAIERTVAVLREYKEVIDAHGVTRVRMAATSAVRDAKNGRDFLDAAREAVGVPAELLSGEEEGTLAYRGATAGLAASRGDDVVVDIGGGSTELIVAARPAGKLGVVSLDIGCVRLTERCLRHDPPLEAELSEAAAVVDEHLARAVDVVPALGALAPGSRLIGLAGTVSTLSMLDQGLATYSWGKVHHALLARDAVEHWCAALAAEPAAARSVRPGMVPGREDVIVAGAIVLSAVMRRFGLDGCLVSESDILDGLVAALRDQGDGA
ncbi:MAG: DUF501 domain-containing protein [Acidimicrobiales bacterium]